MRFDREGKPTPYFNRRDQFRMLSMVGLFALVLFAMKVASRPESWYWLTGPPADAPQTAKQNPEIDDIDFSVKSGDSDLPAGAFRMDDQSEKLHDDADDEASSRPTPFSASDDILADATQLAEVRDSTLGVRRTEMDAFFYLLEKAREVPPNLLERSARKDVGFTALMSDSEYYRGQLLTVRGDVRRLAPFPASENEYGLKTLYEAWLFTPDSGNNPWRFVCSEIPAGLLQEGELTGVPHVRATGYFFKRYGYEAQQGLHTAPMLIGRSLVWHRPRSAEEQDSGSAPYFLALFLLVGVALGVTVLRFTLTDRSFRKKHWRRITEPTAKSVENLNDWEVTDPADLLRQLAESEEQVTPPADESP